MHSKILLPAFTGLAFAAGSANAETIVVDFSDGAKTLPIANSIQASNYGDFAGAGQAVPFTFNYDIASFGIGDADELRISVTTSTTNNLANGGGNGLTIVGGNQTNWWEAQDGDLVFSVAVFDASNNDITGDLDIDLTAFGLRWDDTGSNSTSDTEANTFPDPTVTVAGETFNYGGNGLTDVREAFSLATGETSETSFSASRTLNTIGQFQQLQFNIVPEPGSLALMGLGGLCLLKRRRRIA